MNRVLSKIAAGYSAACRKIYITSSAVAKSHGASFMVLAGLGILTLGFTTNCFAQASATFDDTKIRDAAEAILGDLIEGAFGALVMIIAGLVAIIAAAMGAYRAAMAALVVAVGAFILRSFVSLFFDFA